MQLTNLPIKCNGSHRNRYRNSFYPPARRYASAVFATATCPSVRPSLSLSHAGIVPIERKQDREMYTV